MFDYVKLSCTYHCLQQTHTYSTFTEFKGEVCGNRVVEGSEECDCGWEDECSEGCCNPMVDAPGLETPCTKKSSAACR